MRYRQVRSTGCDLVAHGLGYGDFAEKGAKQVKVVKRRQIDKRTGVGDDQELTDLAASFEFDDAVGVRFPILRGINHAWDAAALQQVHERKPVQA